MPRHDEPVLRIYLPHGWQYRDDETIFRQIGSFRMWSTNCSSMSGAEWSWTIEYRDTKWDICPFSTGVPILQSIQEVEQFRIDWLKKEIEADSPWNNWLLQE